MSNIDSHVGELTPQFPISAVNTTLTATTGPTTGPINKSKKLMAMEKHEPPKEQMFMEETPTLNPTHQTSPNKKDISWQ